MSIGNPSYVAGKEVAGQWRCDKHLEFCKGRIAKRMSIYGAVAQWCDQAWREYLLLHPTMAHKWEIVLGDKNNE